MLPWLHGLLDNERMLQLERALEATPNWEDFVRGLIQEDALEIDETSVYKIGPLFNRRRVWAVCRAADKQKDCFAGQPRKS